MAKKTITEEDIKNAITKVLREQMEGMYSSNSLAELEEEVDEKRSEFERIAEEYQNAAYKMAQIIPSMKKIDQAIKEKYPDIQGPIKGDYPSWIIYKFTEPIPYNDDADSFDREELNNIQEEVESFVPEFLSDCFEVSPDFDENSSLLGIKIIIDMDAMKPEIE